MSISVIIHEVAQEVGDFAILIDSGYSRKKALLVNLVSSLIDGRRRVHRVLRSRRWRAWNLTSSMVSAASFIYIALTDLSPELHHHKRDVKLVVMQLVFIAVGVVTVFVILAIHGH